MVWLTVVALALSDGLAVLRIISQQDSDVGVSNGWESLALLLVLTAVAGTVATLRTRMAGPRILLAAEALAAMIFLVSATSLPLQDPVQRTITYLVAAVFLAILGFDLASRSRDSALARNAERSTRP
jgi:ABC-type transport system involved in cytochrome c biogenesis permease subunit